MKQFFAKFPFVNYDVDGSGQKRLAISVLQRAKIRDVLKNNYLIFYEYDVKDGERPEHIADKLYGSAQYHWLVLMANDMVDPYYDWPMSGEDLTATIRERYTTPQRDGLEFAYSTVHHYEDANGNVIDETTFRSLPFTQRKEVSVYDWEVGQNEAKRKIRLLDAKFVDQIDAEMDKIMKTQVLQ